MRILEDILSLFYPSICICCKNVLLKNEKFLCLVCDKNLPYTNSHMHFENSVFSIFKGREQINFASSLLYFKKRSNTQLILHELKYKSNSEIGYYMGLKMGETIIKSPWYKNIDAIVPVPLSKKRLKKRGYNQCEFLAKGISEKTNIPIYNDILKRKSSKESQTKLERFSRWKNVEESFVFNQKDEIDIKHIVLVDDVITTGATLEACIKALKNHFSISVITLATTNDL